MTLPNAKDNEMILEQFESQFGNETLTLSNDMSDSESDLEIEKKKQFLTYFIGGSYLSYRWAFCFIKCRTLYGVYETFKMHGTISKKIDGLQLMSK